uniref:Uncharacterized protein n=1 Tax=Anguilla anguilla TaxID=7936 RepID=A0A0E9QSK1_ANGAN
MGGSFSVAHHHASCRQALHIILQVRHLISF